MTTETSAAEDVRCTAGLGEFAYEAKFADGKTAIVYERTYSRACVRAQWLRLQDGAETYNELHIVSGKRRTDLDSHNDQALRPAAGEPSDKSAARTAGSQQRVGSRTGAAHEPETERGEGGQ